MKWLCLSVLLALAACISPQQQEHIGRIVTDTVTHVDRDGDGRVSNRELKDSKNDIGMWVGIATGLIGLLTGTVGATRSGSAANLARKVESETDEQWEELKRIQQQPRIRDQ